MKNVFMPYYINGNNIKNLFQIAINRFGKIDINISRLDTTIEFNVPLSELTCGKISQGTARVALLKSNTQSEIDFETKASIDAFINLESILHRNNAIKILTSSDSLSSLSTGDIVEVTATISEIDPILNFFQKTLNLMEFQEITQNQDNSKIISWINKNIDTILIDKELKFSATPNFHSDTNIIFSLDSTNSIVDKDYYLNRPVTIVGQVTGYVLESDSTINTNENDNTTKNSTEISINNSRPLAKEFSKNTIFGESLKSFPLTNHGDTFNLNAHLLWDLLNSTEKYADFLDYLKYPVNSDNTNNTLEIIPVMIYL